MAQSFLLSREARTLSLLQVMRMSDDEAYSTFKALRWSETGGEPFCPKCGCTSIYEITSRKRFKCAACYRQFSVTSGTIFASRKMPIRNILAAIAIFMNGAKGVPALQLSRDLGCTYMTAFVLAHKIREAIGSNAPEMVSGIVEIDGAYFGGHVKPANQKKKRIDLRKAESQSGKRQVVVVMRERGGRTAAFVSKSEAESVAQVATTIKEGSMVHADESAGWNSLSAWFETKRINHQLAYSLDGACTNQAESYFSRLRRAEIGVHHHVAGPYLEAYAREMAWREDNRRRSNGEQYEMVVESALHHPISRQWKGYWQRQAA